MSDALLNQKKNRTTAPTAGITPMKISDIKGIPQPKSWMTGKDRTSLTQEATPAVVMGVLKIAREEHQETCNCELDGEASTDIHLVIVSKKSDDEKTSLTAEMTPRLRAAGHPDWIASKVKHLEGKFVRITGWLMLDTAHLRHTSLLPGEHGHAALARATNWEIHPITKFEVCKSTQAKCKAGQGWEEF